jgi:hypothetical protein
MAVAPLIVYIPGLKPKPEAALHQAQLLRCLYEGVRRIDEKVAAEVADSKAFQLVSWTYDFYGEHRDINLDMADIDTVLSKTQASEADILSATSWKRRFLRWIFHAADYLPFLIPKVATEEVEVHLRDFYRYVHNRDGSAESAREKLKIVIRAAKANGRPVLLIAHSMGSVIAYDSLWQLSREEGHDARVDLLLTTGSPLGQNIVQRHLLGVDKPGEARYPSNIDKWINIAAIGELTAVDRTLKNDFARMNKFGLVPAIDDREVFNYYHMHGSLNVHVEYGYLINEVTARIISEWWRAKTAAD